MNLFRSIDPGNLHDEDGLFQMALKQLETLVRHDENVITFEFLQLLFIVFYCIKLIQC